MIISEYEQYVMHYVSAVSGAAPIDSGRPDTGSGTSS
jgi:hypothetical protein